MAFVRENEIQEGNMTCIRNYNVIKQAKYEEQKKLRCGANFYESARNVLFSQKGDIAPDFKDKGKMLIIKFSSFIVKIIKS